MEPTLRQKHAFVIPRNLLRVYVCLAARQQRMAYAVGVIDRLRILPRDASLESRQAPTFRLRSSLYS